MLGFNGNFDTCSYAQETNGDKMKTNDPINTIDKPDEAETLSETVVSVIEKTDLKEITTSSINW